MRHFGATVDIHRNRWEFLESFQSLSMRGLDHHPSRKALNANQDRSARLGSRREGCAGFSSVCAFFLGAVDSLTPSAVFYLQQCNIYFHLSRWTNVFRRWNCWQSNADLIPREITFIRNNGLNFQSTDQHRVNTGIMRVNIDRDAEEEEIFELCKWFSKNLYTDRSLKPLWKYSSILIFFYSTESRLLEFLLMEQSIIMFRRFFYPFDGKTESIYSNNCDIFDSNFLLFR